MLAIILLSVTAFVFAVLAQHYKNQRDDIALWAVMNRPELFDEVVPDESTSSGSDLPG